MSFIFYFTALISVIASIKVITTHNVLHAMFFCTILLLSLASLCFSFHTHLLFAALFLLYAVSVSVTNYFIIKKLNLIQAAALRISPKVWLAPAVMSYFLILLIIYLVLSNQSEGVLSTLVAVKYDAISSSTTLFLSILFFFFILESLIIALFFISTSTTITFSFFHRKSSDRRSSNVVEQESEIAPSKGDAP